MTSLFAKSSLLACMALSGCVSLAPVYQRPAAPVAEAYPIAPAVAGEAAASLEWRRYFSDGSLRELIELALENNRDLRAALANVERAAALYRVQRAERLPALGASAGAVRSGSENGRQADRYSVAAGISAFELDLFGRVRSLSDAARAQFLASGQAQRTVRIGLVAAVANSYLALLADNELLELTRDTLGTREKSLRLVQARFDHGVASRLDLEQARLLVETARVAQARLQRQRAANLNLLTLLVGRPLPAMSSAATLASINLPALPAGLPADLLANRPDIRQAEQQLIAANANIGAARAAYFPRISLTASAGSASSELAQLFANGGFGWTVAPQLLLPIFDHGRNRANLDAARSGRELAVAQYEKAIQSAFREVADALAGQATYGEQVLAQRAVEAAEAERFAIAQLRHHNGAASDLESLDAQRSLFGAQQALVQSRLALLQNQVTLYRVLGGGQE